MTPNRSNKLVEDSAVQDLREIEGTVGKALHIYDTPANLPKFKDQIITLEHVNDGKGIKAEGDTYNMKRFLTHGHDRLPMAQPDHAGAMDAQQEAPLL